jgi:hypothetical protein
MKISEKIRKSVNKALDFKRDDNLGDMLTDFDIINGILLVTETPLHYEEAQEILKQIRKERKA